MTAKSWGCLAMAWWIARFPDVALLPTVLAVSLLRDCPRDRLGENSPQTVYNKNTRKMQESWHVWVHGNMLYSSASCDTILEMESG